MKVQWYKPHHLQVTCDDFFRGVLIEQRVRTPVNSCSCTAFAENLENKVLGITMTFRDEVDTRVVPQIIQGKAIVTAEAKIGDVTIKYCPWCGKRLTFTDPKVVFSSNGMRP